MGSLASMDKVQLAQIGGPPRQGGRHRVARPVQPRPLATPRPRQRPALAVVEVAAVEVAGRPVWVLHPSSTRELIASARVD